MTFRKSILLLVSLCMIAALVACSSSNKTAITVSISTEPPSSMATDATASVAATTNDSAGVTWTASCGSVDPTTSLTGVDVTYTAPATAGTCTITATSVTDTSVSDTSPSITITSGGGYTVSVSPKTANVQVNLTQDITPTTNDPNGVDWSTTCGTILPANTASGTAATFTAPATAGTCTVTAANATDDTASDTAVMTITGGGQGPLPAGNYVYTLAGADENGSVFDVAGVFTVAADGTTISAGEQDFTDYDYVAIPQDSLTGTAVANTDGTDTILINLDTGDDCLGYGETDDTTPCTIGSGTGNGLETLVAAKISSTQYAITESNDGTADNGWAVANGTMQFQDSSAIADTPSGGYAFYVAGVDINYYTLALGGVLNVDGDGTISGTGSIFDANDGGYLYPAEVLDASTVTAPDSFGRVQWTLNPDDSTDFATIGLAGYIVDANRMELVENDEEYWGINGGTALTQNPDNVGGFTSDDVAGNSYVFGPSGASAPSGYDANGMDEMAGLLTEDSGAFDGVMDFNDLTGTVPVADPVSSDAYSVDPTGDVTIPNLTDGTNFFSLQLYLDGNGNALVITMDDYDATAAVAYQQSNVGSFTADNFNGSYGMNITGFDYNDEMQIGAVGTITADGSSALSNGAVDLYWDYDTDTNGYPISDAYPDLPVTGTFAAADNGVFSGTITGLDVTLGGTQEDAFDYYLYDAAGDSFVIETDLNQLTNGTFSAVAAGGPRKNLHKKNHNLQNHNKKK